jgi:hypothetical protein
LTAVTEGNAVARPAPHLKLTALCGIYGENIVNGGDGHFV